MTGTWPLARAAIAAQLDGLTVDLGAAFAAKTLRCEEFAFAGRQDARNFPYAFPLPAEQRVTRAAGSARITEIDATIRVMLVPSAYSGDMETLHRYYDAWIEAFKDALDDAVTLDGTVDIWLEQDFGPLTQFDDLDTGWGMDMTIGGIRITEVKTFSA
jgi:hypothetical protein